jgi:hypothetical protein
MDARQEDLCRKIKGLDQDIYLLHKEKCEKEQEVKELALAIGRLRDQRLQLKVGLKLHPEGVKQEEA